MNWDAIGAVGEAVGAAGVIISLLYLAVQIRGDARAKRAATIHEQSVAFRDVLLSIADNPSLADLFLRGLNDFSSLTGDELPRFSALFSHGCRTWEDQFFQWSEGHFDLRVWHGIDASIADLFSMPGLQAWWKTRSHWYSEQFRDYIEKKIAQQRAPTMYGESVGKDSGSEVST
jgi:hypothetical protein